MRRQGKMRIIRRAALAGLLLALLACAQTISRGSSSVTPLKPFTPPANWGLFISDTPSFQGAWNLVRLDAGTLKDAQTSSKGRGYAIASADGSTLAEIDYSRNAPATVHIIDARSGTERTSFQPPFAALPTLTPDGSRLFLMDNMGGAWSLYDTATGQVVGKLENLTDPCCGPFFLWLDPVGR